MNTATHMLLGMAVFSRRAAALRIGAAALGGLLPDFPSIGMVLWARWIDGYPRALTIVHVVPPSLTRT